MKRGFHYKQIIVIACRKIKNTIAYTYLPHYVLLLEIKRSIKMVFTYVNLFILVLMHHVYILKPIMTQVTASKYSEIDMN